MKKSWLVIVVGCALGGISVIAAAMYILPIDILERSPAQPIIFSHKLHTGTNSISCLYCHRQAPLSPLAGIPTLADCRGCHLYIVPDAPEIKKLTGYWERQEPVSWVRVNNLPDHVYFPHMMHIRAGIDCSACHGNVAAMERINRTASLKMGWCLKCHRHNKASIDCWTCHI